MSVIRQCSKVRGVDGFNAMGQRPTRTDLLEGFFGEVSVLLDMAFDNAISRSVRTTVLSVGTSEGKSSFEWLTKL
jgi:hypothetical protein